MANTGQTLHPFERDSLGNIGGSDFKGDWITASFFIVAIVASLFFYIKKRRKRNQEKNLKIITKNIFNIEK